MLSLQGEPEKCLSSFENIVLWAMFRLGDKCRREAGDQFGSVGIFHSNRGIIKSNDRGGRSLILLLFPVSLTSSLVLHCFLYMCILGGFLYHLSSE